MTIYGPRPLEILLYVQPYLDSGELYLQDIAARDS